MGTPQRTGARGGNALRTAGIAVLLLLVLAVGIVSCQGAGPGKMAGREESPRELPPVRPPVSAETKVGEPELRVRLLAGAAGARVGGPKRMAVGPVGEGGKSLPGQLKVGVALDGSVKVTDGVGGVYSFGRRAKIEIVPEGGPEGGEDLTLDGRKFLGRLVFSTRPVQAGGKVAYVLDAIETVPIETYLPGVVVEEVFPDWSLATFETQAIAARTYALHQRELALASGKDFDLVATTQDQAYGGKTTHPFALQGVQNTRGVVLTWRGQILRAYYSSTCGGRFAGAAEVWPTGPGYEYNRTEPLQAQDRAFACQPASFYRWEVVRGLDELSTRVREWGRGNGSDAAKLGVLAGVSIDGRNETGRPIAYEVRDVQGREVTLRAEELRLACNQGVPGLPDVEIRKTRVLSGDVEFEFGGSTVMVRGRGFGHGVGMCQWCVQEMSKGGQTWRELLPMFYPGAKLERAY